MPYSVSIPITRRTLIDLSLMRDRRGLGRHGGIVSRNQAARTGSGRFTCVFAAKLGVPSSSWPSQVRVKTRHRGRETPSAAGGGGAEDGSARNRPAAPGTRAGSRSRRCAPGGAPRGVSGGLGAPHSVSAGPGWAGRARSCRWGLEVLAGVGDRVVRASRLGALLAGDERTDVDDPLALLAGDAGPVVGVGGVGQVFVLAELIDAGGQKVSDP